MSIETSGIELHFPPGQQYNCTVCGKCCRADWRIKVHPDKAESMSKLKSFQRVEKEGYKPIVVVDEQPLLTRREDKACHFLGEDDLCEIHGEAGLHAKPAPCKLYPFQMVSTPDGYFVSLAFTCPAVITGVGDTLESHAQELKETIALAPHFFPPDLKANPSVTLTTDCKVGWEAYREWEESALQELSESRSPVASLLSLAAGIARTASENIPLTEVDRTSDRTVMAQEQLQSLLPFFTVMTIATIEQKSDLEKRQALTASLMNGEPHYSERLEADFPATGPRKPLDMMTRSVLQRYLHQQFWGKRLITGPTLLTRVLYLAAGVESALCYLQAKKELTSTLHFSLDLVEWSFHYLENDVLLHHELLLPMFEEWEKDIVNFCHAVNQT